MRHETTQKLLLLDLDNSTADYLGTLRRDMALLAAPGEDPWEPMARGTEPPHVTARRKMITHQPGWWRDLPRLELGFQIVDVAREVGFVIHILSKGPRSHTTAWAEKVQWVDQHLPNTPITLSDNKSLVYSRVLVDDWTPYTDPWLKSRPRGLVIQPAQPWNEGLEPHPRVLRYDGTNRAAMKAALQRAYDRKPREEWAL